MNPNTLFVLTLIGIALFVGAVAHEADIARNCNSNGDPGTSTWFVEIQCVKTEGKE